MQCGEPRPHPVETPERKGWGGTKRAGSTGIEVDNQRANKATPLAESTRRKRVGVAPSSGALSVAAHRATTDSEGAKNGPREQDRTADGSVASQLVRALPRKRHAAASLCRDLHDGPVQVVGPGSRDVLYVRRGRSVAAPGMERSTIGGDSIEAAQSGQRLSAAAQPYRFTSE